MAISWQTVYGVEIAQGRYALVGEAHGVLWNVLFLGESWNFRSSPYIPDTTIMQNNANFRVLRLCVLRLVLCRGYIVRREGPCTYSVLTYSWVYMRSLYHCVSRVPLPGGMVSNSLEW